MGGWVFVKGKKFDLLFLRLAGLLGSLMSRTVLPFSLEE